MKLTMADVTPTQATKWLKRAAPITPKHGLAERFASAMTDGKWMEHSAPIAFCEHRLVDGQARLRALILANMTIRMVLMHFTEAEWQRKAPVVKQARRRKIGPREIPVSVGLKR